MVIGILPDACWVWAGTGCVAAASANATTHAPVIVRPIRVTPIEYLPGSRGFQARYDVTRGFSQQDVANDSCSRVRTSQGWYE